MTSSLTRAALAAVLAFGTAIGTAHAVDIPKDQLEPIENRWAIDSPGKPWSQNLVTDPVRAGKVALRFETRQGDALKRNNPGFSHNEMSALHALKATQGEDYWYGFSLLIPKDFPIHKNRLVLGQWHSYRDWHLGEVYRSPALSQRFQNGTFRIALCHGPEKVYKENPCRKKIALYRTKDLPLGQWNDFVYHVKWTHKDDGYVKVWINNEQVVDYTGPTNYNDEQGPYVKYGIYRDDVPETYVVYFDEYRTGKSREEVDPALDHYSNK